MPTDYSALKVFANHNSDAGPNGHRFRREESVEFKPTAERFISDLKKGIKSPAEEPVREEFQKILTSTNTLLNSKDNPQLTKDIEPWILQFKNLGQEGLMVLNLYTALHSGQKQDFLNAYNSVRNIEENIYELSQPGGTEFNPTGAVAGSLVIKPLIEDAFTALVGSYNTKFSENLPVYSRYTKHKIFTNVDKLKHQPLISKEKSIEIAPVLETIEIPVNGYLGIELEKNQNFNRVVADLGESLQSNILKLEVSADNKAWRALEPKTDNNAEWQARNNGDAVKYIRIKNYSSKNVIVKLKIFKIHY